MFGGRQGAYNQVLKEEEEWKGISRRCNACGLVSLGLGIHLKDSQPLAMHEWRVPKAANNSRVDSAQVDGNVS